MGEDDRPATQAEIEEAVRTLEAMMEKDRELLHICCPACEVTSNGWQIDFAPAGHDAHLGLDSPDTEYAYVCPRCARRLPSEELQYVHHYEGKWNWSAVPLTPEFFDRLLKGKTGTTNNKLVVLGAAMLAATLWMVVSSETGSSGFWTGMAGVVMCGLVTLVTLRRVVMGAGAERPDEWWQRRRQRGRAHPPE